MRTSSISRLALFTGWFATVLSPVFTTQACGPWLPTRWLDDGGVRVVKAPEFYWELEVRRIAKEFQPQEKRVPAPVLPRPAPPPEPETPVTDEAGNAAAAVDAPAPPRGPTDQEQFNTQCDLRDFAEAVAAKKVAVDDAEAARLTHAKAREALDQADRTEVPVDVKLTVLANEFGDYQNGALAYKQGRYVVAREIWEGLLKRPQAERQYRTVWAAYMIGKAWLREGLYEQAAKAFAQVRELAGKGFADSNGLAADSYGWEAKANLMLKQYPEAARLYLGQLSMGDDTAVVSLKHLVPDWVPREDDEEVEAVDGAAPTLEPTEQEKEQIQVKLLAEQKTRMSQAAADPVLRRLTTAHILATETTFWDQDQPSQRCQDWLAEIQKAKVDQVEDAEQLGWVAYTVGRYDEAAEWLKHSTGKTYAALWLKAKLDRRTGKTAEAAQAMADALALMEARPEMDQSMMDSEADMPYASATGDLGALRLLRNEFVGAMEIFLEGDLWQDAAYVAERVLTVAELKSWVDANCPATTMLNAQAGKPVDEGVGPTAEEQKAMHGQQMRWLLGRKMVRAGQAAEAAPYLPAGAIRLVTSENQQNFQALVQLYHESLKKGQNTKLTKEQRARAYFTAACIARQDGMELLGAEVEPDAFFYGGNYEMTDVTAERSVGKLTVTHYGEDDKQTVETKPLSIPASAEEKKRLGANKIAPEKRFHYRYVAADLAWKAGSLLPDGSEHLADVLNTAGNWLKSRDADAAKRYHKEITSRCPDTVIGKAVKAKRWFVDQPGDWSAAETKRRDKALGIQPEAEADKKG